MVSLKVADFKPGDAIESVELDGELKARCEAAVARQLAEVAPASILVIEVDIQIRYHQLVPLEAVSEQPEKKEGA